MNVEWTVANISTHLLQEVPPLDVPELLAYFVKQSGPFLDQIGVGKGTLLCITYMGFHCHACSPCFPALHILSKSMYAA